MFQYSLTVHGQGHMTFHCCYLFFEKFIKILLKICGFAFNLSSHFIKNVYHSMQRGMNHLLLENESPLGKPYWKWKFSDLPLIGQTPSKMKIFWPPP